MLKHIGVVGKAEGLEARLQVAAPGEVLVSQLGGADAAPGMLSAIAVDATADGAAEAVLAAASTQEALLGLLADAVDCREGIALGGSRRVCDHASRFAKALALGAKEQLRLERGALLRDIGKLSISNEVLLKNTVLTYDEWILLQQHTELGVKLLEERGICTGVTDIVGCHHECYDGTGYPKGIERDAIPRDARIMKILDVYCAMTSPRHYRKTQSTHESAVEYLSSERGKHFDPELIDVFLDGNIGQTAVKGETEA